MRSLKKRISELTRKQSRLLAFCAGMLSTLAMAPLFIWPIMFLTMSVMLWLIDSALRADADHPQHADETPRINNQQIEIKQNIAKTFWLGWSFGFGYFLVSLYWIGSSFLVEPEKFALLLPFAVTLLPAGLACFYGLGFAALALYWPKGPARLVSFSFVIFLVDWLRGHILTGFPWNLIGHSLTGQLELMQSVTIFGLYGLSAIAVLIFASPATLADVPPASVKRGSHIIKIIAPTPTFIALISLLFLYAYGAHKISKAGPTNFNDKIELVLIQPDISQKDKLENQKRLAAVLKTIAMTEELPPLDQSKYQHRYVIWPETAIPYALNNAKDLLSRLGQMLPENTTLITGAFHVEKPGNDETIKVYNSLFVINDKGEIINIFDKHHLVPFGEYLPLPNFFRSIGLTAIAEERGGFQIGPEPKPIPLPNGPAFLPSICYEAIFPLHEKIGRERYLSNKSEPGKYVDYQGAQWLINISNDAWFGRTAGPHQHAHQVKIRAVETGLPMVRVVNSGITAIYDGLGRTVKISHLGSTQNITSPLPHPQPNRSEAAFLKNEFIMKMPKELITLALLGIFLALFKRRIFSLN